MNDEEKKAIEALKYCVGKTFGGYDKYYFEDNSSMMIYRAIQIVLNLIKKQQKEIKELKKIIGLYKNASENVAEITQEVISNHYISRDKIKEKIKDITLFKDLED